MLETYKEIVKTGYEHGRLGDGADGPHARLPERVSPTSRLPLRDPQKACDTAAAVGLLGLHDPTVIVSLLDEHYGQRESEGRLGGINPEGRRPRFRRNLDFSTS